MKTYTYITPDKDFNPLVITKTEDEIIEEYWEYWKAQMRLSVLKPNTAAYKKPELITRENCIMDWITVNWAKELK